MSAGLRIGPYVLGKVQEKEEDRERKKETVCASAFVLESEKKRQSWPASHANDKRVPPTESDTEECSDY